MLARLRRQYRLIRDVLLTLLTVASLLPGTAAAIDVPPNLTRLSLGSQVELLADDDNRFTFEQILAGAADGQFFKDPRVVPIFPRITGPYWARIRLRNTADSPVTAALVVDFPNFRKMAFYAPTPTGYRQQQIDVAAHLREADVPYRNPAYTIDLAPGEEKIYFLSIAHNSARFPLSLWSRAELDTFSHSESLIQGLLLGVLLCTLSYQLALSVLAREPEHWSLSLVTTTTMLVTFTMLGYQHTLFGDVGDWLTQVYLPMIILFAWSVVLFGRHFLLLAEKLPRINQGLLGVEWAFLGLAALAVGEPSLANIVFPPVQLVGVLLFIAAAGILMRRRDPFALLFMVSLMPLVLVGTLATATNHGIVPLFDHYHSAVAAGFASGVLMFAFSSAYRIGRRREERRRLAREKQRAEDLARTQTAFLATMSHEVRTPLNAIMGMLELLGRHSTSETQRHYLKVAADSSESLLVLINQILDFSRLESDVVRIDPTDFCLPDLLQGCFDLSSARASSAAVRLDFELSPAVPQAIHADADKVRQIVLNLLDNAIKFTPAGRITLSASVRASDNGPPTLRVQVTDTGIGVAVAARDKIFERFQQADSTIKRRYGGAGLGLSICRTLARAMGGDIGFRSVDGAGSTFWLNLPIRLADASVPRQPTQVTAASRPMHLLVADDNAVNREITQALLEDEGHTVVCASDGQQALDRLEAEAFDCVLMDISMPVMDGLEAMRRIRRHRDPEKRALRIVALTAHAFPEKIRACLDAGADAVVTKPVRPAELDRVLAGDNRSAAPAPDDVDKPADQPGTLPLVDLTQHATNIAMLGDGKVHDFVVRQRAETHTALADLHAHLVAADYPALADLAHHLAGAYAFLGFSRLRARVLTLEGAARAADPDLAAFHLGEFDDCVADTEAVLDELMAEQV